MSRLKIPVSAPHFLYKKENAFEPKAVNLHTGLSGELAMNARL